MARKRMITIKSRLINNLNTFAQRGRNQEIKGFS